MADGCRQIADALPTDPRSGAAASPHLQFKERSQVGVPHRHIRHIFRDNRAPGFMCACVVATGSAAGARAPNGTARRQPITVHRDHARKSGSSIP